MRTKIRGTLGLLLAAGLVVTAANHWGTLDNQQGQHRDAVQRPSKIFDDRQTHTIKLVVRYRPARQLTITWGIDVRGDVEQRFPKDSMVWEEEEMGVVDGTIVNVSADNFDEGGYLYCAIEQDKKIVREFPGRMTEYHEYCDLDFVVGGR